MDPDALPLLRWKRFGAPAAPAEALVLQVHETMDATNAEMQASRWRSIVPRSAFAALGMDLYSRRISLAPIQELVHREAKRLGIGLSQIVVVGFGDAAQRALDLLLCNALADVHAILVDLPSASVVVGYPPARGAFRFVQHRLADDPGGRHFDQTIHTLRLAGLDIRTMVLPNGEAATERATDAFLVELVARASRAHPLRRSAESAPTSPEQSA